MLSVKVEDYGETEDEMHYVTYRVSGLNKKELDFLLNNLEGETVVEDGDLLLNIFYSRKFFPFASDDAHFKLFRHDWFFINIFNTRLGFE